MSAVVVVAVKPQTRARGAARGSRRSWAPTPWSSRSWPGGRCASSSRRSEGRGRARHAEHAGRHRPRHHGRGANRQVDAAQRALADALLAAIGAVEWVEDESLMDAVTAVRARVRPTSSCWPRRLPRAGVAAGLPAAARRNARARDRRRLRRAPCALAARRRDVAAERHLAGRHHRRRARCADGCRRPRTRC